MLISIIKIRYGLHLQAINYETFGKKWKRNALTSTNSNLLYKNAWRPLTKQLEIAQIQLTVLEFWETNKLRKMMEIKEFCW